MHIKFFFKHWIILLWLVTDLSLNDVPWLSFQKSPFIDNLFFYSYVLVIRMVTLFIKLVWLQKFRLSPGWFVVVGFFVFYYKQCCNKHS